MGRIRPLRAIKFLTRSVTVEKADVQPRRACGCSRSALLKALLFAIVVQAQAFDTHMFASVLLILAVLMCREVLLRAGGFTLSVASAALLVTITIHSG